MSDNRRGWVDTVDGLQVIYPKTPEDVVVGEGGDLRVTDCDGEVHIWPNGRWGRVRIEKTQE